MFLLVGLGNPGKKYANNRHNIGFKIIDAIVQEYSLASAKSKYDSEVFTGEIASQKIVAIKPLSFMNLSGNAVAGFVRFYKLEPTSVIVIHDDIDLCVGKIKTKIGGGAGGHNGLRSIDQSLGQDYQRIRIGVDHPGNKDMVSDYVLHDFEFGDEQQAINQVIKEVVSATIPNAINQHKQD